MGVNADTGFHCKTQCNIDLLFWKLTIKKLSK